MVVERPGARRIAARAVVPEKKELVHKHREPMKISVRNTKIRVTPEPNAPQLIRIVRKPYVQETTRGKKVKLEKMVLTKRERVIVGEELRLARDAARMEVRPRPTSRTRVGDRPRPDLHGWLAMAAVKKEAV